MLRQTKIQTYICLLLFSWCHLAIAYTWKNIAPGIQYIDMADRNLVPWSHIHVFKIDLNQQQLDIVTARDLSKQNASVKDFAAYSNAVIAINGGFFDTEYQPLGLRLGHDHHYSKLKSISWWGVFYIADNQPHLSNYSYYKSHRSHRDGIDFAIQSGPRLLIDGKTPKLKPGVAERTALGITDDKHVILLVTERSPMTTASLSKLMRLAPLSCEQALNLDGGSSSQIYAQLGLLNIHAHGLSNISDAVVVKARK
ncbi:MAG: phosphodiester glycosidase family protein [Legionellaceae bacterium]|nr:phosphodiester glycosidase family protein [Legionellaceae bacterium]